jgi:predicted PurR-regulated permease PerM
MTDVSGDGGAGAVVRTGRAAGWGAVPRVRPDDGGDPLGVIPDPVRIAAALSWRLLVIAGALYVIGTVVTDLAAVVVPVAIAVLLATLLAPAVGQLVRRGVPRAAATAVVLIAGLVLLGGLLTFVVITFIDGVPALATQLAGTINTITTWLATGPLHLSAHQLQGVRTSLLQALNANQSSLTAGALTTAANVGETLSQVLLVLFTLAFLLHDGGNIWRFLLRAAPVRVRARIEVAGRRSLAALLSYVRATAAVAVVDALGIGIGLAVLGVPLAIPLAALVFLGAFVPILGAVVVGAVAVLVAWVANGLVTALILLGIVIAVMQLEGHVLQPWLLGRAVKLHPLAVVLMIAAGFLTAGIAGALLAVPLLAVLNSGIRSLLSPAEAHVNPADVHASQPDDSAPVESRP